MSEYWFKPRRYGLGATPTTWQGWAVIAVYVAVLVGTAAALVTPNQPRTALFLIATAAETAVLVLVCWRKTDGAWRWRWGGE